ncbi:MAG: hypothetical protein KDK36_15805, partial [Leptospiraceae bacterium]|nr:hypothetical protein [Leptospiraceae bacterium]
MEKLEDSLKFKLWMQSLKENNITVKKVEEKAIFRRGNGEVLFAFLTVDAIDEDKRALPSAVLLRGDFVSVLTCLIDKDSKKKYLVLVKQKRVGTGEYLHEHPARMCDNVSAPFQVCV